MNKSELELGLRLVEEAKKLHPEAYDVEYEPGRERVKIVYYHQDPEPEGFDPF